jgi:hypothetical protein
MISVITSEIKNENNINMGFTRRQTVAFGAVNVTLSAGYLMPARKAKT